MNFLFRNTGKTPLEIKQEETETKRLQGNIDNVNSILESASNLLPENNQYNYNTLVNSYTVNYASNKLSGILSSDSYSYFSNKQDKLILTTNGSSGAATLIGRVLNIPQYSGGGGGGVTSVTASTPLSSSGGATPNLTIQQSSATQDGYLSASDWSIFNGKQSALTFGNLTESTSSVLTITGGTGSVIGSGTSIQVKQANATQSGFLSSTDWSTFNSKGNGTVTSVSALTLGTTGTDLSSSVATGTTTPVITLNVPTASATNRGVLSAADWTTFNGKQNALTNPVTGTGTNNEIAFFNTTGSTIGSLSTATYPSLTELSYVKGATSSIQTQLNGKQGSLTLTTTGTSGAATLVGNTLNIPQYSGGGGGGISTLNTLTASTQTFATGSSGSDFNISSAVSTHTFNIPDAGASARGVVTTGTQTLAGAKTFSSAPTFSTMTAGSVLFAGTSGLLSQDNANLFWDNTNKRLGIGTSSPAYRLEVKGTITASSALAQLVNFEPTLTASANNDFLVAANINATFSLGAFTGTSSYLQRWQTAGTTRSFIRNTGLQQWNLNSGTLEAGRIEYGTPGGNTGMAIFDYDTATSTYINRYNFANEGTYFYQGFHTINSLGGMALFNTSHNLVLGYTGTPTDAGYKLDVNGTTRTQGDFTISDTKNVILGTSTGTKIGTATSQKLSFWNATPIVQPTTAVAGATRVGGAGTTVTDTDTFDGYTIAQIVKALRNAGLLA